MTEVCELYGISRKTSYKFVERCLEHGPEGLAERSRQPHPRGGRAGILEMPT